MLIQFRQPDGLELEFADLTAVKAEAAKLKDPITSLVGEVVLGAGADKIAIDARWVASITLSQKPSIEVILRVPSPLPQYPGPGSEYFELRLVCENATQW